MKLSMLQQVTKGRTPRPRRTLLYGVHGIGKTTWASKWPEAVIIPTEDGNADIDCASFPLIRNAIDVLGATVELSEPGADHGFKTAVLDSADWLERLIWKDLEDSGQDLSYGRGSQLLEERFQQVLRSFDGVRNAGMHVVILAHCNIVKVSPPGQERYDQYQPKLKACVASLLQEWADECLFAMYETHMRTEDEGWGRERGIAYGEGRRILRTTERPGWLAKNRLGLPDDMAFDFEQYRQYLPPVGDLAGSVVGGTSKPKGGSTTVETQS